MALANKGRFKIFKELTAAARAAKVPLEGEPCQDPVSKLIYIGRGGAWVALQSPSQVFYEEIDASTTSSGAPYVVPFDAEYDVVVIVATNVGVGGGFIKMPDPTGLDGRTVQVWNAATLGILTVQNEVGIDINTISPPSGGSVYTCVNTAGYKWRRMGGDGSEYVPKSAFTTKGQILVATGSGTYAAIGVGTNGQVLTADSAQASGVKWSTVSGGGSGNLLALTIGSDGTPETANTNIFIGSNTSLVIALYANAVSLNLRMDYSGSNPIFIDVLMKNKRASGAVSLTFSKASSTAWTNIWTPANGTRPVYTDIPNAWDHLGFVYSPQESVFVMRAFGGRLA